MNTSGETRGVFLHWDCIECRGGGFSPRADCTDDAEMVMDYHIVSSCKKDTNNQVNNQDIVEDKLVNTNLAEVVENHKLCMIVKIHDN